MIQSRLYDLSGIQYPIIQAGMGPFSNKNLCMSRSWGIVHDEQYFLLN